jgi:cbb3-type cytochrome oxidase maturation protein
MFSSTIALIILSIFIGTAAWLVFIWAVKKGQFDDIEGPKYRMLEDDPELPDDVNDREKHDD